MMEPPPSQGRIKYPLGSISALTKPEDTGPDGPPMVEVNDLSHICSKESYINIKETHYLRKNLRTGFAIFYGTAGCMLLTARLPSSKLVVYLSVQKSRAAASVVGA